MAHMASPANHLQPNHKPPGPIDALAAAAAAAEPALEGTAAGAGKCNLAAGGWEFPVFVGHRRRLAPDDELFEAGNIEREQLARQVGAASTGVASPRM